MRPPVDLRAFNRGCANRFLLPAWLLLAPSCRGNAPATPPSEPTARQPQPSVEATASGSADADAEGDPRDGQDDPTPVIRLAAPPWHGEVRRAVAVAQGPIPQLKVISATKNAVVDDEKWFQDNGLAFSPPFDLPAEFTGEGHRSVFHEDHAIVLRGEGGAYHTLIAIDRNQNTMAWFDFSAYVLTPEITPEGTGSFDQSLAWAVIRDGVLYVSSYHMGYARTSGGLNAYITALDVGTGELLWRSPPLVSNSANFLVRDGWIVTGYGFTKEDDFVLVLDQRTGAIAKKVKVKSGPTYLFEAEGRLLVRTYDTNYELSL